MQSIIDYITFTVPRGEFPIMAEITDAHRWMPHLTMYLDHAIFPGAVGAWRAANGDRFHDIASVSRENAVRARIPRNRDNPFVVNVSGSVYWQDYERQAVVYEAHKRGFDITRLDVAFDLVDEKFEFDQAYEDLIKELDREGKRSVRRFRAKNNDGIAIGSRQSQWYLRIYDKQKESGTKERIVRYELECKGRAVQALRPWQPGYQCRAARKILDMVGNRWSHIQDDLMYCGIGGELPQAGRPPKPNDVLKWYRTSVLPAMDKLKQSNPEAFSELKQLALPLFADDD